MPTKSKNQRPAPPASQHQNGFSLISNDKLLALYTAMLESRMFQERAQALLKENKLAAASLPPRDQEAAAVGVLIDLLPEDTVALSHSNLTADLIKGVPLKKLFHAVSVPSDAATPFAQATKAAAAHKQNKNKNIAVAYATDKQAAVGPWQEALSVAALHRLPMIFVSWVKDVPLKAKASDIPAMTVEGNDVVAVYRVATEAITHARKGNGPTHIQCVRWNATDPILTMETYLTRKGLFTKDYKAEVVAGLNKQLDAALKASPKLMR